MLGLARIPHALATKGAEICGLARQVFSAGRLAELQEHAIEGVAAVASETRLRMVVIRIGQELRGIDELEAPGLELLDDHSFVDSVGIRIDAVLAGSGLDDACLNSLLEGAMGISGG